MFTLRIVFPIFPFSLTKIKEREKDLLRMIGRGNEFRGNIVYKEMADTTCGLLLCVQRTDFQTAVHELWCFYFLILHREWRCVISFFYPSLITISALIISINRTPSVSKKCVEVILWLLWPTPPAGLYKYSDTPTASCY